MFNQDFEIATGENYLFGTTAIKIFMPDNFGNTNVIDTFLEPPTGGQHFSFTLEAINESKYSDADNIIRKGFTEYRLKLTFEYEWHYMELIPFLLSEKVTIKFPPSFNLRQSMDFSFDAQSVTKSWKSGIVTARKIESVYQIDDNIDPVLAKYLDKKLANPIPSAGTTLAFTSINPLTQIEAFSILEYEPVILPPIAKLIILADHAANSENVSVLSNLPNEVLVSGKIVSGYGHKFTMNPMLSTGNINSYFIRINGGVWQQVINTQSVDDGNIWKRVNILQNGVQTLVSVDLRVSDGINEKIKTDTFTFVAPSAGFTAFNVPLTGDEINAVVESKATGSIEVGQGSQNLQNFFQVKFGDLVTVGIDPQGVPVPDEQAFAQFLLDEFNKSGQLSNTYTMNIDNVFTIKFEAKNSGDFANNAIEIVDVDTGIQNTGLFLTAFGIDGGASQTAYKYDVRNGHDIFANANDFTVSDIKVDDLFLSGAFIEYSLDGGTTWITYDDTVGVSYNNDLKFLDSGLGSKVEFINNNVRAYMPFFKFGTPYSVRVGVIDLRNDVTVSTVVTVESATFNMDGVGKYSDDDMEVVFGIIGDVASVGTYAGDEYDESINI